MTPLIIAALLLNIAVLIPVCFGLLSDAPWAIESYGAKTAARDILLAVYFAIAVLSAVLLMVRDPKLIAALLMVQVIYKFSTVVTVGLTHPVVSANLMIAVFHSMVLLVIWRTLGSSV